VKGHTDLLAESEEYLVFEIKGWKICRRLKFLVCSVLATAQADVEFVSGVTTQSIGMSSEVPLLSASSNSGASTVLSTGPSALPPSVVSSPFPVLGLSSTPSAYPTQATPTRPPAEYAPPRFPAELTSPPQPSLPLTGFSYTSATTATTGSLASSALPPPPTMGFVPSHGIVTAHPSKVIADIILFVKLSRHFTMTYSMQLPHVADITLQSHLLHHCKNRLMENNYKIFCRKVILSLLGARSSNSPGWLWSDCARISYVIGRPCMID
jgi:hypothetical protein